MTERSSPFAEATFSLRLQAAHSGSAVPLGELLERYRDWMLQTIEPEMDSEMRPKVGASDIVQASLVEASAGFAGFRGKSEPELRRWLKTILLNNLLNEYRAWRGTQKRNVRRELPLSPRCEQLAGAGREPDPVDMASSREQAELLHSALKRLPSDYRDAILLRHREHFTFEEIGLRMNRSPDAARMLWYRAFDRLSLLMESRR